MRFALLALPAALLFAEPAAAQRLSRSFDVSMTVLAECQVNTQDLDFGVYDPDTAKVGQTLLTLRCTPGTGATVTFDGGSSGNGRRREMQGPAPLAYRLYRDVGLRDDIGSDLPAFVLGRHENEGQAVTFPVYGEIPALQQVPPGDYLDTIRVTVEF